MNRFVTTNSVTSFAVCPRRAFFVLRGEPDETPHEYELVVEERAARRRSQYLSELPDNEIGTFQKGIP
jgi:hypothetical protein